MIKSEIEKNRTLEILSGIEKNKDDTIKALNEAGITDSKKRNLILGQTSSIATDLKAQLELYEALKQGDASCLRDLTPGQKLIAFRILKGMSQSELAIQLKVSQAAVNKDERNEYSGASFEKLERVATAIGCRLEVTIQSLTTSPDDNHRKGKDRRVG
jgi:DNA-binding XRE family transcriptional regulator